MSYRIKLRREALAELKRLPAYVRAEALDKIESLKANPRPSRAQELRGKPDVFRLWIAGHWRLVYGVDDEDARVWVLRVRHKGFIDYESLSWEVHEPAGPEYVSQLEAHTTITDDFRLQIPREIRRQLALEPGQGVRIVLDRGVITLTPIRP